MAADSPLLDQYSLAHVAVGALADAAGVPALATLAASVLFEAGIEDAFKATVRDLWPDATRDSTANLVGDTISVMAGFALHRSRPATLWPLVIVASIAWVIPHD